MTLSPQDRTDQRPEFVLRTLGAAGLYAGLASQPVLGPGKPLAVLTYLAVTAGRRVSREHLMDLLWADLAPERARAALRQALFHLRRLLGESSLAGVEELSLAIPVRSDRDAFLQALDRDDLEAALEAYTGAFLPDFGVPGGAAFEQWADLERGQLEAAFLRAAEVVVRRRLNQSRFREAQRLARRVRDELPRREGAWRLLLEAIEAGGDHLGAVLEAEALEGWADREGVALEPATRLSLQRARGMNAPPDPAGADSVATELVGREREFAAITAAWESTRLGQPRHIHLSAPAGLGKSRLLHEATARMQAGGATVVRVRAVPGSREIPYAVAGDLAAALATLPGATGVAPASAASLVGLNPSLSSRLAATPDTAGGADALRRRTQALADLLQATAEERPLVLAIDDLHWADPASMRALDGLLARLGRVPVLTLTAARPERVPVSEGMTRLTLAPLPPEGTRTLVTALGEIPAGPGWAEAFVQGLHGSTGGSPLLILETLRLALDEGVLARADGTWQCLDPARLPDLLRTGEAHRQRVRMLPPGEAWTLALLATAGTPLDPAVVASAAGMPAGTAAGCLLALERQGLAMRIGEEWAAAHDEIAAAAESVLDPARQRQAHAALGTELAARAGDDRQRLLRGLRHLAAAGDGPALRLHFRRQVRLSRAAGDARPLALLAADVLGADAEPAAARALVRSLPVRWRLGLWSRARQAVAAAGLAGALAGSAALVQAREARHATLQHVVYLDAGGQPVGAAARPDDFDGRTGEIALVHRPSDLVEAAVAFPEVPPAVSPDGRAVAWNRTSADSTTIDVWIRTPAGVRRLTREPRDDLVNGWAPDGSALVGMSNRWSDPAVGGYDIARFDTATGAAHQVTRGPAHDREPFVSPDGSRIAFLREDTDGRVRLCLTDFDGMVEPDCRLPGGHVLGKLVGWAGLDELLLLVRSPGIQPLVRYRWASGEVATIASPAVRHAVLSPDRRWVVASLRLPGVSGYREWLLPLDRPHQGRRLSPPGPGDAFLRWWEGRAARDEVLDRLVFADTGATLLPGVGHQLALRALTSAGTEIPLAGRVRWSVDDTLVATVDADGVVHPRRHGTVTVRASAGGWRTVTRRFTVAGARPAVVLEERWDANWRERWIPFGDPAPVVTVGPGGIPAFWNRGDGTYLSSAVLGRAVPAAAGAGVEVMVSTPVTGATGLRLRVSLTPQADTAATRSADPRGPAPEPSLPTTVCVAAYPGDGDYGAARIEVASGIAGLVPLGEQAAAALRSGRWWTLRLQVLPDGRCGLAVNGRVAWISEDILPLDRPLWLRIGDASRGARLLHGPLTVWTGVRTDVDWTAPPR
jgi:DNA-binding SARP family transcriptional activator